MKKTIKIINDEILTEGDRIQFIYTSQDKNDFKNINFTEQITIDESVSDSLTRSDEIIKIVTSKSTDDVPSIIKYTESSKTQDSGTTLGQIIVVATEKSIINEETSTKAKNEPLIVIECKSSDTFEYGDQSDSIGYISTDEVLVTPEYIESKLEKSTNVELTEECHDTKINDISFHKPDSFILRENVDGLIDKNVPEIIPEVIGDTRLNKENIEIEEGIGLEDSNFKEAFTIPEKYLPKKRKIQLQKKGKQKLPSVGTSDEWWERQIEKEEKQKIKEEKIIKRKKLQEEKKKLAEEKKKLEEQMKQLQKKIKEETKLN